VFRDPSGRYGTFVWSAYTTETPGPVRVGGEFAGFAGSDTSTGPYVAGLSAAGVSAGGEANYGALFSGEEDTYSLATGTTTSQQVTLAELAVGPEAPDVVGFGYVGGTYRGEKGDWGLFFGIQGGILGQTFAFGTGFSFSAAGASPCPPSGGL
jgi:hypothetical protein